MLILTEGASEIEYFYRFRGRNRNIAVIPVQAKKHDSRNLVPYCASKVHEYGIDFGDGDTVSVVIDVDDRSADELRDIEAQCMKKGFRLYLSNRSFECWLILHFRKLTKPMNQDELEMILSECIGRKYKKSEGISKDIGDSDILSAIERAEELVNGDEDNSAVCYTMNPSTTVHRLVKIMISGSA